MVVVRLVLMLLSLSSVSQANDVTFVEQPDDIAILPGETVVFKCQVSGYNQDSGIVAWIITLDSGREFLYGPAKPATDSDTAARYSISGNPSIGRYDLRIADVKDTDAGVYRCLVATELSRYAKLVLEQLKPPDDGYPKCYDDQVRGVRFVGETVSVTCESKGGRPAAVLTWDRDGVSVYGNYSPNPHAMNEYQWTLTNWDDGKVFTCTAVSPEIPDRRTCTVGPLSVLDPRTTPTGVGAPITQPVRPTVKILPTISDVVPGDEVVFTCILSISGTGCLFSWKIDEVPIRFPSDRYRFENQNRTLRFTAKDSDDFTLYYCEVHFDANRMIYASALLRVNRAEASSAGASTGAIVGVTVGAILVIVLFIVALLVYLHYRKMIKDPKDLPNANVTVKTPNGTVLGQAPVILETELDRLDMKMFREEGPDIMFRNQKGKTLYVYQNGEPPSESFS
ncbi:kin of IRRE-like protein 1 [Ptychodera flava]|uniref:kin of IRRE-like protein 1 n=1 Tax=Ptychodera flava TaxID=63121 RepID=UPI00396AA294